MTKHEFGFEINQYYSIVITESLYSRGTYQYYIRYSYITWIKQYCSVFITEPWYGTGIIQ